MRKNKKRSFRRAGDKVKILGVGINSSSVSSLLETILGRVEKGQKTFVVTPNPEFIVFAQKSPWFREILNQADLAIPDGVGLVWASRWLSFWSILALRKKMGVRNTFLAHECKNFKNFPPKFRGELRHKFARKDYFTPILEERISGTDLMEKLCQQAARRGWSVYLLGGGPGVAKKTLVVLQERYPDLKGWATTGPEKPRDTLGVGAAPARKPLFEPCTNSTGEAKSKVRRECTLPEWRKETEEWVQDINRHHPDLLFVAFGMGKQEKFIWDNWDQLDVRLAMGVGGAFDYLSGKIPRAPVFIRKMGFEWLHRLLIQPWRWRRQLALVEFVCLILKEKFEIKKDRIVFNL